MRRWLPIAAWLAFFGCDRSDEIEWTKFNSDGDSIFVAVGADEPPEQPDRCTEEPLLCDGEPGCICLRSSLRAHDVGVATAEPPFGPVGTRHVMRVSILEDYAELVQRVEIVARSVRGEDVIPLRRDSAQRGSWAIEIESLGSPDERRRDEFDVYLFEPAGVFSDTTEEADE